MTMTLEEAAEKVLLAAGFRPQDMPQDKDNTDPILSTLKSYGDQRFIEGATAMREMAARKMDDARNSYFAGRDAEKCKATARDFETMGIALGHAAVAIRALNPNQLKDTDHG